MAALDAYGADGFHRANQTPNAVSGALNQVYAESVQDGVSAAGTNIGTATLLTAQQTVVSTTALSTGVVFDASLLVPGAVLLVRNDGANPCAVYGGAAVKIDGGSAGASAAVAAAASGRYLVTTATQLRTV